MEHTISVKQIEEKTGLDRLTHIVGININLPEDDLTSQIMYMSIIDTLGVKEVVDDGRRMLRNIHLNDITNIILRCYNACEDNCFGSYDNTILTAVMSIFTTFKNLRTVSFTVDGSQSLLDDYVNAIDIGYKGDRSELFNRIYTITDIEIHLSDHLDMDAVDMLNRMFVSYGFIPNDYMTRRFVIDFKFDEYINFFEMVFKNNRDFTVRLGSDAVSLLMLFPVVIIEGKPSIRLVTNYSDL